MYIIKRTKDFERSFKKLKQAGLSKNKRNILESVIDIIALGQKPSEKYKDHQLKGELRFFRECHIFNDLLVIYKIEKDELILVLVDIGSHAQLFG